MSTKHTCLALAASALLFLGCGNKPTEEVPTTPPGLVSEPFEILKNLQYIGIHKDLKQFSLISQTDLDQAYAMACRLHKQCGDEGLALKDDEILSLGVTDLRTRGYLMPGVSKSDWRAAKIKGKGPDWVARVDPQKLDLLPENDLLPDGKQNPEFMLVKSRYAFPAMQAGVYRVMSGIPDGMWPKLSVLETRADAARPGLQVVSVGFEGSEVLEVAVGKNLDGSYSVRDIALKAPPKALAQLLERK